MSTPQDPAAPPPDEGGQDGLSAGDLKLLSDVGAMLRKTDPVPEVLVDTAKQLLVWRDIDAQLAIISDGDRELEGVRGAPAGLDSRTLSMTGPHGLVLELQMTRTTADRVNVLGQIAGVTSAVVVAIRTGAGIAHTSVDDLGTFEFTDLPAEKMRLLVQLDDEPLLTPWFTP